MTEPLVVRREIQIAAPLATVFAFLSDPEKILRWIGTEVTVSRIPAASISSTSAAETLPAESSLRSSHPPPRLQLWAGRGATRCTGSSRSRST